jgi:thioredoxin 1
MSSFSELIGGDKPVLVDFFATWCGPCKVQAPILEEVKQRVGDDASIIKVDVDRSPEVAQLFQIRGVPTLIVFKKGKVRWRQSGVFPANDLERVLRENMDE